MKKYLYLFLTILSSCITEVPLKTNGQIDATPVIHLFIEPDSFCKLNMSAVTGIMSPDVFVDGAQIQIYKNQTFQSFFAPKGNGNYLYSGVLNSRDSFKIKGDDGLRPFEAVGKVPVHVFLNSIDTSRDLIPGVGPAFTIHFSFKDSANDDNYYRIYLKKHSYKYVFNQGLIIDSSAVSELISVYGTETPFVLNNYNTYTSREILFSDETFNGTLPKFDIFTTDLLKRSKEQRPYQLEFVLENIEKSLFDYYNTRNAHLWQQRSITQLPGVLAGNVKGAYGVVGSYTKYVKRIGLY